MKRFFIEKLMKMLRFALSAEAKISHLNASKGEKLCVLKVGFWAKVNLSNVELMEGKKVGGKRLMLMNDR